MKKLLTILLTLVMCLSFSACKEEDTKTEKPVAKCSEQDIRMLMERNLDCYYLFYVSPLNGDGLDSEGYSKADTSFFGSYSELQNFVESTYTKEKSDYLLSSYPNKENPLYKDRNGAIYVDLDAVQTAEYNVMWDESYTIEFTESSSEKCSFTLSTLDFEGAPYQANGEAVYENGCWLLSDLVY